MATLANLSSTVDKNYFDLYKSGQSIPWTTVLGNIKFSSSNNTFIDIGYPYSETDRTGALITFRSVNYSNPGNLELFVPTTDKSTSEIPTSENSTQLNKDKTNKEKLNTDLIKYPSINQREQAQEIRWIDRYNKNTERIKNNIEYDTLVYSYDKAVIDEIVSVMAEVLTIDTPYYTIEKKHYPTELVRQRFLEIDYSRLEAFMLEFSRRNEKIRNTKAYLITSLFNIPATAETNLSNMVKNDLYGNGGRRKE